VSEEAVTQTPPPPESQPSTREATLADIDRLESIPLEEIEVDLSGVIVPEGRLNEAQMSRAVGNFVEAFHPRGT
jgi:hypothetical protein